jgi:hypothetical protein
MKLQSQQTKAALMYPLLQLFGHTRRDSMSFYKNDLGFHFISHEELAHPLPPSFSHKLLSNTGLFYGGGLALCYYCKKIQYCK